MPFQGFPRDFQEREASCSASDRLQLGFKIVQMGANGSWSPMRHQFGFGNWTRGYPKIPFFSAKKIRSSDYDWTCGISPQCYKIMDAPNCNLCGEHDVQLLESVAYSSIWFVAKLLKQTFNGHRETRRCCAMSNLLCGALSQWSVWK